MKALNRAIARTVSQIHRITTPDDCYLPLVDKLRQHLDDLMALELKQLEQAGIKVATIGDKSVVNITSPGRADGKAVAKWILRELERTQAPQPHANDNAQAVASAPEQPAPDAIDMTDPRNWRAGDVLRCVRDCLHWEAGQEGVVTYSDSEGVQIKGHIAGQHVDWPRTARRPVQEYFTWLRHGESEVAA